MKQYVYAVFPTVESARMAFGALLDHGAVSEDVSLIVREPYAADFEKYRTDRDQDVPPTASDVKESAEKGLTTTTGADATVGAAKGAGVGLGVGALAALASVMIPGFGLAIGGGALAMALAGAAGTTAAGAVAGGLTGYLKDQGVPEEHAEAYADSFERGAALVSISVPSGRVDQGTAESLLAKYHQEVVVTR